MPEIMRFSLYKNKLTKYIFGIVLACFIIPICNAQNRHVNDFHFATWNSRSAHWPTIIQFMIDGNLDVLTVQEAGRLPGAEGIESRPPQRSSETYSRYQRRLEIIQAERDEARRTEGRISLYDNVNHSMPQLCYIGRSAGDADVSSYVEEYVWTTPSNGIFYLYYYDRRTHEQRENADQSPSTQGINIAIITRQRADRNFFMIPVNRGGAEIQAGNNRFGINRPVIGVQLENAVFFDIHAEPVDTRNEASAVVNIIQNYMANNYPMLTWAATGDFNRPTNTVNLSPPSANTFTNLLSSGRITHPSEGRGRSEELDYGFWGGPIANQVRMASITLLTDYIQNQIGRFIPNPSDHIPVKFN
ncbi:hypothetical protein CJJ19_03870 [Candidatus Williamhamiltonella defendens]|nr:hypothetical protein [Candidatus Hamiltonella defensa]AYB48739.1 hypothetical protein CJJ19_03870 [Candidatus Hamiltonella defensa]